MKKKLGNFEAVSHKTSELKVDPPGNEKESKKARK